MDYVFAPGSTPPERNLRTFFERQPDTQVIDNYFGSIDLFIKKLNEDPSIVRPLDNIIIVSHGTDGGYLSLPFGTIILSLRRGIESHTTYEVLEYADSHNTNDLIPSNIDGNTKIAINGCKIGQAQPFVQKLKECFGGSVPVSAPKHFDAVFSVPGVGIIESLSYDFSFAVLHPFRGRRTARTQLIAAFQAQNFKFLDGTDVPHDSWSQWLPHNVSPGKRVFNYRVNFSPPLKRMDGTDLPTLRLGINNGFRAETQQYVYTKEYAAGAPTERTQQEQALRAGLQGQPNFNASHPFPVWQRYELENFDAFIAGFDWIFSRSEDLNTLICTGTRVLYTLAVPITQDPLGANNLLLNIAPEPGNTSPSAPQLLRTNSELFLTI